MACPYVRPTGAGYVGVYRIAPGRSVTIATDPTGLPVGDGDRLYATRTDGGVLLTTTRPPEPVLATYEVTQSPQNPPRLSLGGAAFDALGVSPGDDVRAYDHERGLLVVPATDDPRVTTAVAGGGA